MNRNVLNVTRFGALALGVAAGLLAGAANAAERQILLIHSMTGPAAFASVPALNGMQLAIDEVNASGFLGNGDTIKAITADDGGDRNQTFAIINTNIVGNPDILAILGPTGVGVGVPAGGLVNQLKIPMLAFANGTAVPATGEWAFMSHEGAVSSVPKIVGYAHDTLGLRKCAAIYAVDNDAYVTQAKAFMSGFEAKGTPMKDVVEIKTSDSDFSAAATRVASLDLDCVYVSTPPTPAANLVRQLRTAGLSDDIHIFGSTSTTSPDFVKMGGSAVNGVTMLGDWVPGGASDAGAAFAKAYTEKYGIKPDSWAPVGYTMGRVLANAIKNAGPNPTRQSVRDALASTKDFPVITGDGKYSVDPQTRYVTTGATIMSIKDGEWTVVK